jgi:hypothetical protein
MKFSWWVPLLKGWKNHTLWLMVFTLLCDKIHPKWMKHRGTKNARFSIFLYQIQLTVTPTKRMKNSHTLADFSGVFHPCMSWNSSKVDETQGYKKCPFQ